MAEEFLEEQIKRIREMTKQVSRVRPLHDIRESRNHSSDTNGTARDERAPSRRHAVRARRRSR
jgi:hypothetical protein